MTERTPAGAPVESATEARQGVTGQGVLPMLLWGCAAVVVAFVVVYFVYFAGSPAGH